MTWSKKYGALLFLFISFCLVSGFYLGFQSHPQITQALNTQLDLNEKKKSKDLLTYLQPSVQTQLTLIENTLQTFHLFLNSETPQPSFQPEWLLMSFEYIHDQDPVLKINHESSSFKIQKDPLFIDQLQNKVHQKISQMQPEFGKSFEITLDELQQNSMKPVFLISGYFYEPTKARVLLIDPSLIFNSLKKIDSHLEHSRLLIVDPEGTVLYHSLPAFIGSKISTSLFTELKADEAVLKTYESIDKTQVYSALSSLEKSSLIFLVETPVIKNEFNWASAENITILIQTSIIFFLIFIGFILHTLLLNKKILAFVSQKIQFKPENKLTSNDQELPEQKPALKAGPVQVKYKEKIIATETEPPVLTIDDYQKTILSIADTGKIPEHLCKALHMLSQGPVLYFQYIKDSQTLKLMHSEDLDISKNDVELVIDTPTYNAILQCEKEKKIASLSHYLPLHEILKNTLHEERPFEAWAITTPYNPNNASNEPEFIGAAILFQKGFQDDHHKKSFIKILRSVGLAYETHFTKS